MGKKGVKEEKGLAANDKEGKNLLGQPTFKELENGRFKCVETGHEVPGHAKDSYANTKHCRLGLIDAALARNQPPLNMFLPDPLSSSKLICKLTGDTVNKSEEHVWKHINGRRFLNMLEKKEAEKETSNGVVTESEKKPEKKHKPKADSLKKKKKKQQEDIDKVISEVRNSSDKDRDSEEAEFWMPPAGERWDFDDGCDRWGSGSESWSGSETEDASVACASCVAIEDGKDDATELSKRTKRTSIDIGPIDYASRKKKTKTKPT